MVALGIVAMHNVLVRAQFLSVPFFYLNFISFLYMRIALNITNDARYDGIFAYTNLTYPAE